MHYVCEFVFKDFLIFIIEQIIFDFRFLALLAIGGSLAGSLLCFLNVILLIQNYFSLLFIVEMCQFHSLTICIIFRSDSY